MARRTENDITKINSYEKCWKIKTNKRKFRIIPVGVRKKNRITMDGEMIEYSNTGKILSLTIWTQIIAKHVNEIATKENNALAQLTSI